MAKSLLILRLLVSGIAIFLLCVSAFLYENEEGKVQSKLEGLWIKIDDLRKKSVSRHIAFIQVLASQIDIIFSWVFGRKYISFRSFCLSVCFVLGLLNVAIAAISLFAGQHNNQLYEMLLSGVISFAYGLVVVVIREKMWFWVWYAGFGYFVYKKFIEVVWDIVAASGKIWFPFFILISLSIILMVGIGAMIFAVMIYVIRKNLAWFAGANDLTKMLLSVLVNCSPALMLNLGWKVLLFGLAFFVAFRGNDNVMTSKTLSVLGITTIVLLVGVSICFTSFIFMITAAVAIGLSMAMILHRLFWPLLGRPVYALQRYGVTKRRSVVASMGLALLIGAWGKLEWLDKLVDKLSQP